MLAVWPGGDCHGYGSTPFMTQRKIRLLLADDHLIVRIGLRSLIETQPDMEVVAEAAGGIAAVAAFNHHKPDVALMDLRMPDLSGAEATAAIRRDHSQACIIVLTTYDHEEDVYRALEAGASGYLIKNNDSAPLLDAIAGYMQELISFLSPCGTKLPQDESLLN